MKPSIHIAFDSVVPEEWLAQVSGGISQGQGCAQGALVYIDVSEAIEQAEIFPYHIVSLAAMVDALKQEGAKVYIRSNKMGDYLYNELHFKDYFVDNKNFLPSHDESLLSLWRVKEGEIDLHPELIQQYLKRTFFSNKDLSAVKLSLLESYYNIFDHAEARNNAWSMMMYDEQCHRLYVAVGDLGIGIPTSVKRVIPSLSDEAALLKAMEPTFTSMSRRHNRGLGLGYIKDACTEGDSLTIVSNQAKLATTQDRTTTAPMPFLFPGTLIYYELTLTHFENEEIIDNFEI